MRYRVVLALCGLLASSLACGPPPTKHTARHVGKEAAIGEGTPSLLASTEFVESPPGGDPKVVGCADGQREGFADLEKFPDIAGCLGDWEADMSLRKAPLKRPCGDDMDNKCKSPADVCAEGWHVCGRSGDPRDLSSRIDARQCSQGAGPGKFVAAISHVLEAKVCPPAPSDTTRYACMEEGWGSEPVCCGQDCSTGKCKDAVWPGQTPISVGQAQGCGAVWADRNGAIMCCQGSDGPPARTIPAQPVAPPSTAEPPAEDAKAPANDAEAPSEASSPTP